MLKLKKLQQVFDFSHPSVRHAYLKKILKRGQREEKVLILETYGGKSDAEFMGVDPYVVDLVTDLKAIKDRAIEKFGAIDRIDIRVSKQRFAPS